MKPKLPTGFYKFSRNNFFNYQLNRWYSLGYTRLDEIKEAGNQIKTVNDNRRVFTGLAEKAEREGRIKNAAFYYRAAEFLTPPGDPHKEELYFKFSETFYSAFKEDKIERHQVPYENSFLSAMKLTPTMSETKGTILIHGGFDSFIEEFYCMWKYFAESGYRVIAFDGPGQGASLVEYHLPITHDWEKPVSAVLDYFREDDVSLMGISFGGYWCVRAAAFEKRIKRLIVNPPVYDWMGQTNRLTASLIHRFMKWKGMMNTTIRMKMKMIPAIKHFIIHSMHINRNTDGEPISAVEWLLQMNKDHIHSELVSQDVLILAGEKDKFQPVRLYHKQKAALVNARSVTGRIFTAEDHGQNHCQMGNLGLALDVMVKWLDYKS